MTRYGAVGAGRHEPGEDWREPPDWEIPGFVTPERLVCRAPSVLISAGPMLVYSSGLTIGLTIRLVDERPDDQTIRRELGLFDGRFQSYAEGRMLFGLRGASGGLRGSLRVPSSRPGGSGLLHALGFSGATGDRGSVWRATFWTWPAVVEDTEVFAEWPDRGAAREVLRIPAESLATARAAVRPLP